MKGYAYYPGCSLLGTAKEYDKSTRVTCEALDIELTEIPDWSCCGASAAHSTSDLLATALPARNLALVEEMGQELMTPCAACFSRLALAEHAIRGNEVERERINRVIGRKIREVPRVRALLDVFADEEVFQTIKEKVVRPLEGLKVASYYGCLLVRPTEVGFDDPEDPQSMDRLVAALGAEPVNWPFKTECCGMSYSVSQTDMAVHLVNRILAMAKANGADCVVTACPMCQGNLDTRQALAEQRHGASYNLPVFYITQLVGLALGIDARELALGSHLVDPRRLLRDKEIA